MQGKGGRRVLRYGVGLRRRSEGADMTLEQGGTKKRSFPQIRLNISASYLPLRQQFSLDLAPNRSGIFFNTQLSILSLLGFLSAGPVFRKSKSLIHGNC